MQIAYKELFIEKMILDILFPLSKIFSILRIINIASAEQISKDIFGKFKIKCVSLHQK